jgi:hypothetical protein
LLFFRIEPWSSVQPEIATLMVDHWKENANFREDVPLDPDWELYRTLEQRGILEVLTARSGRILVGYYVSQVLPHPHYRSTLYGFVDIYFLARPHRTAANGIQLFEEYEAAMKDAAKRRGFDKIVLIGRGRIGNNGGAVLERLGWKAVETCFTKLMVTNG